MEEERRQKSERDGSSIYILSHEFLMQSFGFHFKGSVLAQQNIKIKMDSNAFYPIRTSRNKISSIFEDTIFYCRKTKNIDKNQSTMAVRCLQFSSEFLM
jgi:hypothetical protein